MTLREFVLRARSFWKIELFWSAHPAIGNAIRFTHMIYDYHDNATPKRRHPESLGLDSDSAIIYHPAQFGCLKGGAPV